MSHLTIAYQEHPFYVGSPFFDQILWMRTWSAEIFLSKVIGGIWMLNYSRLQPVLFRELSHRTACRFTTNLISRCAFPEVLQTPKSLDGCFPVKVKGGMEEALPLPALPESLWDEDWSNWMDHAGNISKEFKISEEFRSGHPYAYGKHRQIQPCIYFSHEWPKQYSGCHCQYQSPVWKMATLEFLSKASEEYFRAVDKKRAKFNQFTEFASLYEVICGNQQAKNDPHWKGGRDAQDVSSISGSESFWVSSFKWLCAPLWPHQWGY